MNYDTYWQSVFDLLERRGWEVVTKEGTDDLVRGMIKPPLMEIYSIEEAYEKEGFVHADIRN